MKTIINDIAQSSPGINDREAFAVIYRKRHPQGADLTADNVRQAFDRYKAAARKVKRMTKKVAGTFGPERIPR